MSNSFFDKNEKIYFTIEVRSVCKLLKEIRGLSAEALLAKYNVDLTPPIDLSELARKLGVSIFSFDFSEIEKKSDLNPGEIIGAAVSVGNTLSIFYAKGSTDNRARFTIAHELGHACRHTDSLELDHVELRTKTVVDEKEKNANIFAGELLIPEAALDDIISLLIKPTITSLADIFKVSVNVMRARLKVLNKTQLVVDDAPKAIDVE